MKAVVLRRIVVMCFFILAGFGAKAQIVHIDPAGDGGFSTGTSLLANGWDTSNGGATQTVWACNVAPYGAPGNRAAFISQNGSTQYTNTLTANRVVHMWRQVTVPAGNTIINLSFTWKCVGFGVEDRMRVFAVPNTYTPVLGTQIFPTYTQVGLANYSGQGTWTTANITLPASLAGTTFKLVFEWRNDGLNNPNGLPVAIDDILLTSDAPPVPDDCVAASALTVSPTMACVTSVYGTTVGATQSLPGITCNGQTGFADDDVWYSFTATTDTHIISATTTTFDHVIDVRSGACDGTTIGCSDSVLGVGTESVTVTGLTVGSTYFVRVYSYLPGIYGDFTICVTTPSPPTNDNCAGAVTLPVSASLTCASPTSGTTLYATQSQAGCTGNADDDVWYQFTATSTSHFVTVNPGTLTDAVVQVFSGTCGTPVSISCTNSTNGANAESAAVSGLTVGSVYRVRVYSAGGAGNQGTFTICVTTPPPGPINNTCAGAISLPVNASCTFQTFSTISATDSGVPNPGCAFYSGGDVWFSVVVPASGTIIVDTQAGGITDSGMALYTGTCGGLTLLECDDDDSSSGLMSSITRSGLTPGTTIFIRVWEFGNDNPGTFGICVTTFTPSGNDNCSGAVSLTVNPNSGCVSSSIGTTTGATQSQTGCFGTADDDVWYSFTATATSHVVTVTPGTMYDAVIQVFSGSCGSLSSIACVDNTFGTSNEAATVSGLTIGQTYFVRVYSWWGAGDEGTFTICVTTPVIPTPCTPGPGTGTTALGCPSVISGGLGLSGADPAPLNCLGSNCTQLEATYLQLGNTTNYTFEQIPFNPPYQFDCLANPVSVNIDDVWSPMVTLPFNFCFYGNNYNQVLISSNGVITFDTTNYSPGGYSTWSFGNTLPSTSLFMNSIFGVYHDIDPSLGGQVGWELITLNTGCRALVTAWHDVPMYSCTSTLFTGMIVLYENTNVIEVYVEEKNICSSWNGGNALIGIQNATGTAAVAPPGRNSVTADWNGIPGGEAWRFTPSGPSITSIRWFEGPTATGTPISTGLDVITVCPSVTTTYTAEVMYTLCNGTILREEESVLVTISPSKVWNGSVNTNWSVANNWTPPGVPTNLDCVVVPNVVNDAYVQGTSYDAFAYSVNVQNGGLLQINSGNNLTITNYLNVAPGGTFNIMNSGSLIQVLDVANTGIMNMERITLPIYRFDYVYWNSPVTLASNYTLGMLSPNTQFDKYYSWEPCCTGLGGSGNWLQESAGTVMDPRKGYIVRGPNTFSFTPDVKTPYTANFIGTPNNGQIVSPISFGNALPENDKWNLIGNPYPSSVSATAFISSLNNSTILDGTLYFWAHNTAPAEIVDPFYGDFVLNYTGTDYAAWNSTGGTAAFSGGQTPNGYISAGQSFFVKAKGIPGNAIFENSMRRPDYNVQFFRPGEGQMPSSGIIDEDPRERHRIWLNLQTETGLFNQTLVGYVQGATVGKDRDFDGEHFSEGSAMLYSLIDDKKLVIQGRSLPFSADDTVPLGYTVAQTVQASIRLSDIDGLFNSQDIYLEDKLLNVIHDLKSGPYNFVAEAGTDLERFVLRYTNGTQLSSESWSSASTVAYISQGHLNVRAQAEISQIVLYDVSGKKVHTFTNVGASPVRVPFNFANGVYVARIEMSDGSSAVKKLVH